MYIGYWTLNKYYYQYYYYYFCPFCFLEQYVCQDSPLDLICPTVSRPDKMSAVIILAVFQGRVTYNMCQGQKFNPTVFCGSTRDTRPLQHFCDRAFTSTSACYIPWHDVSNMYERRCNESVTIYLKIQYECTGKTDVL